MTKQQEQLFNDLFLSNYIPIKKYVSHITPNTRLIEDIVQETFLIAMEKIDILEKHTNPIGWLYKTAYYVNLRMNHKFKSEYLTNDFESTNPNVNSVEILDTIEPYPVLSQILTKANLELLCQHHIEGYTYEELAKKEQVSLSAIKMRFSRITTKLKNVFKICDLLLL